MWWFYSPPLGLHVKSTLPWPLCCQHASPAKRKRLSRGCRTTISNNRRQNQENHKSKACTVKNCCCSVAPLSLALRNYELSATSRRLHKKPEVKKKNSSAATSNWSFTETKPCVWIFLLSKGMLLSCCKYYVCRDCVFCFGLLSGCFNSLDLNIITFLQLYKKKNHFTKLHLNLKFVLFLGNSECVSLSQRGFLFLGLFFWEKKVVSMKMFHVLISIY